MDAQATADVTAMRDDPQRRTGRDRSRCDVLPRQRETRLVIGPRTRQAGRVQRPVTIIAAILVITACSSSPRSIATTTTATSSTNSTSTTSTTTA